MQAESGQGCIISRVPFLIETNPQSAALEVDQRSCGTGGPPLPTHQDDTQRGTNRQVLQVADGRRGGDRAERSGPGKLRRAAGAGGAREKSPVQSRPAVVVFLGPSGSC